MRFSLFTTCGLLAGAIAAPTTSTRRYVVHERRDTLPSNWRRNAKLHGNSYIPLRFALTQRNLDKAEEFLMDVSHPESPNYGKHWSPKQVAETFAPSEEAVIAVVEWLGEVGITGDRVKQSQSLNWIYANATVAEAEQLLDTKYYEYVHSTTKQAHVACEEYSLPESIREHIDFVTPTVHFDAKVDRPKKRRDLDEREAAIARRQTTTVGGVDLGVGRTIGLPGSGSLPKQGDLVGQPNSELADCDISIVPDCLRALYDFPADYPSDSENSYGIVEYTPQAYIPSDLDMFFSEFEPSLMGKRPTFNSIDGGFLQTLNQSFDFNGESDLDLQYGMSLVYPQQVTLYQVGDYVEGASFNNFLDALDASYCTYDGGDDPDVDGVYPDPYPAGYGVYKGPNACGGYAASNVISTSYSYNEYDLTPFYEIRQCHEYMKLGLQGITFLYSSGDYGVAGNGDVCIDVATGQYNNGSSGMFNPSFPGTCPYITSVGATQIKVGATVTQPEQAAESVIYSGGGFSNVFAIPSYQEAALETYFKDYLPPYGSDRYNTSQHSRGFPDVAANGVNYVVAINGEFIYVFGTSCSSPVFGSILTLINSARLAAGKSVIGFINPVLYANPSMLNDITEGSNPGCGTAGFNAVPGWDPVTGLGTPNFERMLDVWLALS